MPDELTTTAVANDAAWSARSAVSMSSAPPLIGRDFASLAASAAASSNVDASKLIAFVAMDRLLDTRSVDIYMAGGDTRSGLARFATRQGAWLVRREAFEDLWQDGRSLCYFALNAGGMGTEGQYGPFCVVVPDPSVHARDLAVFPGDSAQTYTDESGAVDRSRLDDEIASWNARSDLVLAMRLLFASALQPSEWPTVICAVDNYMEVAMGPTIGLDAVTEVRVRRPFLDMLRRLEYEALGGSSLSASDQELIAARTALRRRGIPVKEVD